MGLFCISCNWGAIINMLTLYELTVGKARANSELEGWFLNCRLIRTHESSSLDT